MMQHLGQAFPVPILRSKAKPSMPSSSHECPVFSNLSRVNSHCRQIPKNSDKCLGFYTSNCWVKTLEENISNVVFGGQISRNQTTFFVCGVPRCERYSCLSVDAVIPGSTLTNSGDGGQATVDESTRWQNSLQIDDQWEC